MHILFLSDNFTPETNAAANRVYERACYWVKWGHRVTVLTSAPNKPIGKVFPGYKNRWLKRETIDGIEVVRVKTFITQNEGFVLRLLDFLSYMYMSFFIGLFLDRPDVVCATSPQFFTAISGWALSKVKRRPFVFEVSDLWPGSISAVGVVKVSLFLKWAEKIELFLYRQSGLVVALTHAFKQDIASRGISQDKIHTILNGVDLPRLQELPRDPELENQLHLKDKFVVGYLGTHGLAQGLPAVIDMIADPRVRSLPNLHFLFVGAGVERDAVVQKAQEHKLTNISFLENQPKSEVPKLWSLVDLALVSLKNDPVFSQFIPSKIFEAMGARKPVLLLCPKGEAHAIVETTGAGWAIEPGKCDLFEQVLRSILMNPDEYWKRRKQSGQVAEHFSRETQARLFIDAISTVKLSSQFL